MSETACPSCGDVVNFDDVSRLDACPSCSTGIEVLFGLARDRFDGSVR